MSERSTQKTIPKLTITGGIAKQTAVDEHGNDYVEFHVDWLAGETVGYCDICDTAIEDGWFCLDGGTVYCEHHVKVVGYANEEEAAPVSG